MGERVSTADQVFVTNAVGLILKIPSLSFNIATKLKLK